MNIKTENYIFWAPGVSWEITETGDLKIQNFIFKGEFSKLFPIFYFETAKGIQVNELIHICDQVAQQKVHRFIERLLSAKILVENIQDINALFFSQGRIYKKQYPYDEEIRVDAKKLSLFIEEKLSRTYEGNSIELENADYSETITCRRSIRKFDESRSISFSTISALLGCLKQVCKNEKRTYYYPSAGGLYPIDVYIYIKESRVENLQEGLYRYLPLNNNIYFISEAKGINDTAHYFMNKSIFNSSAISLYFVYDADVSFPKYASLAYYYALLDSGIMLDRITLQCEELGLGSCIIGEMNFQSIANYFNLTESMKYLHCIEIGIKEDNDV